MSKIKYDGIEFDNVHDLYEYRQLEKQGGPVKKKSAQKKKALAPIEDAPKQEYRQKRKYKPRKTGTSFSSEEDALIKIAYEEHPTPKGHITKKGLKSLSKALRRKPIAISCRVNYLKRKGSWANHESPMLFKKAKVPKDQLAEKLKWYNKQKKPQEIPEFPALHLIHGNSQKVLEDLFRYVIGNKGTLRYHEVANNVQLTNGNEWNGNTWREFCIEVKRQKRKICEAFCADPSLLQVLQDQDFHHYIQYG